METAKLKKFAQFARRTLLEQVSAKLKLVLAENSAARRESTDAIKKLEEAIKGHGKEQVIERVAYIWFNRFCALRFMDVNRYTRIGVVSPSEGQFQPEILAEAKMGHIDEEMVHDKVRQQIFALLDGKAPSRDPQGEAYRLLVVAACNFWNKAMPFLFQRIDDYTELLMPDDLLSGNSILAYTREAMTPDACEDVEVIGWLYQFYISEKKDEVFDGLKKNKKIAPENIPAATQLFTPHWIVRYLVENSLGRLWMLNRPNSKLKERMDYYIEPQEDLTAKNAKDAKEEQVNNFSDFGAFSGSEDFLVVNSPEEIKICDPACGSGHMLTYAFDLLYAIYEEEGYEPAEIPEKILTNNLYGIEIDERAGELAAFALTMKARAKQRRFFSKGIKPNTCVLENIKFDTGELNSYMDFVGRDLFTASLQTILRQFDEADNFGSLIRPDVTDVDGMLRILESKNVSGQLFISMTHQKVLQALRQADYLSPKYHVVIANPPYMGGKGMNGRLAAWVKENYPNSKSDLFGMFIERNLDLVKKRGAVAMITMQSWMFLNYFEKLRSALLGSCSITSMCHLGPHAFDSIGGEVVQTTAFVMENIPKKVGKGLFLRLVDGSSETEKKRLFSERKSKPFKSSTAQFMSVAGNPIIYWVSDQVLKILETKPPLRTLASIKSGLSTGDNEKFVKIWSEVNFNDIEFNIDAKETCNENSYSWTPYNKGGESRRWFGNNVNVVFWKDNGAYLKKTGVFRNPSFYFREGITWSGMSSKNIPFRYVKGGFVFDSNKGPMVFQENSAINNMVLLGLLNTPLTAYILDALNPTVSTQVGDLERIPVSIPTSSNLSEQISNCISISQSDWDSFETSWDFTSLPLLNPDYRQPTLKATYQKLRAHWREMTLEMQRLEEENNRIFIEAYGLQDELTPEVPLNEITLNCNPHYRYGVEECEVGSEKWEDMEARLLQDTVKELVSYAVGCMFGRYSLDMPGLVLANQGESIEDFCKKIEEYQKNEREKLSGTDCLAEGDGFGGADLSSDQKLSQGGTVRSDESDPQGGSFNSIEHSGGASASIDGGVQKLSVDSTGFPSRSGNPTDDRSTPGLPPAGESGANPEPGRGNQTHDLRPDSETDLTSHLSFVPDEDNVIPMLDGDWFTDDIAERFRKFLRVAFGEEHYEANLQFVEQALNIKGKRNYSIRDYFLGEFYTDHVKRYKKRPIYWLFSSPKGSFNALIYMHRYRPDTVSVVLNDYLREFRTKLTSHKNHLEAVSISASSSQGEKTKALKEIEKITKMIAEMEEYEREVLYPLATEQVEIDLDDGVKVNYPKLGAALKKIVGLDAKDD